MRNVPNTKHIIHRKNLDVYEIVKKVNGKNEYFGRYHNLKDAIKWRDYFQENNWNTHLRLMGTPNKNIYFKLGKYRILKKIKGKEYYFGSFNTYEEAETRLKQIRLKGWENVILDNEQLIETTVTNIIQLRNGKYEIVKNINGIKETFGVFQTYEEAEKEVKLLRKCNWDYDAICEGINENEEVIFIDNDKKLKSSFQKTPKNDFYWAKHEGII